ncbi:GntR family transcriptional regulator [Sphingomonas naphthae]|uniref:GntR family transcriptional regulator n=1 Tax=Sphingomonas naphthae TaxID=1813468 RepID=A0ABY7TMY3_9SPHN|nr:GntR family transcriptional regulator [Sphingomonas naphthae]WCT73765.1 GntR family transcriptional regulator [Sphingomonas naphthae]
MPPVPPHPVKTAFTPIQRPRAFEIICESIRNELIAGRLKAGDKLPPERELALQFQVSRTALREALRTLEVAGIIRNMKGAKGGAVLQAAEPDRVVQAMQDYVTMGSVDIDELTEVRLSIQDHIVRLACERATEEELDRLEAIARRTAEVHTIAERYACSTEYYALLAQATRNRIYALLIDSLTAIFKPFTAAPGYFMLQETLFESRMRLVTALRARDADTAAAEIRAHLEHVHQHIRTHVKGLHSRADMA